MRLRRCLFVFALVLVMPLIGLAQAVSEEALQVAANLNENIPASKTASGLEVERAALPVPTPLAIARRDAAYTTAYHDVYHILSQPNPCSSFFGGALAAVEVLNNLFDKLETGRLRSTKTSMVMTGPTRRVINRRTGASYRLFEKAVINTSGPFYQQKFLPSEPLVPSVGSFEPNTREARAAILLHELGHLLQGTNGQWLLPNDGANDEQSRKNTGTIEERCGEQIKGLSRAKGEAKEFAPQKGSEPKGLQ